MAQKAEPVAAELLERYDRVIAAQPGVERKGAAMPYTSVNGNMFSYLDRGHLVLRLPAVEREAFLERHSTTLHEAYGIVQKEYVDVPDEVFDDPDQSGAYFQVSCAYAASLRPKPTKRTPRQA
jgi:hypothetical protein